MTLTVLAIDLATPGEVLGLLAFGVGFVLIFTALMITLETSVLQWFNWGPFRECLKDAAWVNLASALVGFGLLGSVTRLGWGGIVLAWLASVIIEGFLLQRRQPGSPARAYLIASAANVVSYGILIVPTYATGVSL